MDPAPLVLGHRGACRVAPENTIAAFRAARDLGADGVELDVRRTADGILVVHHDPAADGVGLIASVDRATLRAACPDLPTLAEALDTLAGLLVDIEVKCLPWEPDFDADRTVVRAVADLVGSRAHDIVVSSFDLGAIDACREHAPRIPTGWLTHGHDLASAAGLAAEHHHEWLHPDRESARASPAGDFEICHAAGLMVDVWTVDDPDEIRALAAAGVDAIITNVPDVALRALGR